MLWVALPRASAGLVAWSHAFAFLLAVSISLLVTKSSFVPHLWVRAASAMLGAGFERLVFQPGLSPPAVPVLLSAPMAP